MSSNRQKKKLVHKGVARLKHDPNWNPANFTRKSPQEQLRDLDQESKNQQTYTASTECQGCVSARADTNDTTALCEVHLQEALGF